MLKIIATGMKRHGHARVHDYRSKGRIECASEAEAVRRVSGYTPSRKTRDGEWEVRFGPQVRHYYRVMSEA